VSPHAFLSSDWISTALALYSEYDGQLPEPTQHVRINLLVTAVPHGAVEVIEASIDTAARGLVPHLGHLDEPETTVILDYATARTIFLEADPDAVGQAFIAGRIEVQGDLTRVFMLQTLEITSEEQSVVGEVAERLASLTT